MKSLPPLKCFVLFAAWCFFSAPLMGALVIEGTLFDGPASTEKLRSGGLGSSNWKVPVSGREIEIRALKHGGKNSWKTTTNPQGAFRIETKLQNAAEGAPFVAIVNSDGRQWYSRSFGGTPGEKIEIFAYPASANPSLVRPITRLAHTLEKEGKLYYLKVQCEVEFWNRDATIYIGEKNKSGGREVYRLPIPAGAFITRNEGISPGTRWKKSADGRFLIIDEPVSGLADLMATRSRAGIKGWFVEYRIPATDLFIMNYPQSLPPMTRAEGQIGFLVYVEKDDMKIDPSNSKLQKVSDPVDKNPFDETPGSYDVYGLVSKIDRMDPIRVPIEISDVAVGQVSKKALLWHGGTIAVILLAILGGLAMGRSRGASNAVGETMADGNLDALDKIARLDYLNSAGEIHEKEYRRRREVLVEIAAGEIEQESADKGGGDPVQAVSSSTRDLLGRLQELDSQTGGGVEEAQERAHLLESLYKSLRGDLGG